MNMECILKLFLKSAVAFFFLFFLHGTSIGNGHQGISYNSYIDETKPIINMATALGIFYVQTPNNYIIDPFGNIIEPKVYKGNKVIINNRKQLSVSKLPHLNYQAAMEFKNIFV